MEEASGYLLLFAGAAWLLTLAGRGFYNLSKLPARARRTVAVQIAFRAAAFAMGVALGYVAWQLARVPERPAAALNAPTRVPWWWPCDPYYCTNADWRGYDVLWMMAGAGAVVLFVIAAWLQSEWARYYVRVVTELVHDTVWFITARPGGILSDIDRIATAMEARDGRDEDVMVVQRPAAVVVVPVEMRDGEPQVLLVRRSHPAVGELALLEAIVGEVDRGGDPWTTAKRSLVSVAGMKAERWEPLGANLLPSPDALNEPVHGFAAHGLEQLFGADSTANWVPLSQAIDMVGAGEIRDLRTRDVLFMVDRRHHEWDLADR